MKSSINNTPECIGVIMDGNRRWAKAHSRSTTDGHRAGYDTLESLIEWAKEETIKYTIVYAFSTENWNRTKEEIGKLMKLFEWALATRIKKLEKQEIRIMFIGERERFSEKLQKEMYSTEERTKQFDTTLVIALSYGGRSDILSAVRQLVNKNEEINEDSFSKYLWTKDIPDPDLIIRTGGEKRLSNFLLWQSAYSEIFFSNTLWPDFSKKEFRSILSEYSQIDRRHGK